jgi:4a-hydroxytetrahydrobiopterin dehydratase
MKLTKEKCVPCQGGEPTVSEEEMAELKPQVPDWQVVEKKGANRLKRTFEFEDFAGALNFTNQVGEIAEEEGHHPLLVTEWGKVTVTWWTHKIDGLHRNDFIMAAKTDDLYRDGSA